MPTYTPTPPRRKSYRRKTKPRYKPERVLLLAVIVILIVGSCIWAIKTLLFSQKEKNKGYDKGEAPWTIALDAGHGGTDPGAQGLVSEAEMTEQTVRRLEEILQQDSRFKTVLCREYGETVEKPSERAIAGNKQGADLLLSVHGNSDASNAESYGFECYPVPPGRELAEPSLEFGKCIAQAFSDAGARLRGTEGIRYAYYEGENEDVKVIREGSDQTVYESQSFGFLEYADCPAVLAEQCFITNPNDVQKFATAEGINTAANAYYQAICAFFEVEPLQIS